MLQTRRPDGAVLLQKMSPHNAGSPAAMAALVVAVARATSSSRHTTQASLMRASTACSAVRGSGTYELREHRARSLAQT